MTVNDDGGLNPGHWESPTEGAVSKPLPVGRMEFVQEMGVTLGAEFSFAIS